MTEECVAPYFSSAFHQVASKTCGTLDSEQSRCGGNVAAQLCETLCVDRLERFVHLANLSQPQLIAMATVLSCVPCMALRSDFAE
jgi:hypothetical protein